MVVVNACFDHLTTSFTDTRQSSAELISMIFQQYRIKLFVLSLIHTLAGFEHLRSRMTLPCTMIGKLHSLLSLSSKLGFTTPCALCLSYRSVGAPIILTVAANQSQKCVYSELLLSGTPNYLAHVPLRLKSLLTISGICYRLGFPFFKRDKSRLWP